ncbi:B12-binding domain-containing protein [Microbispora sp. NPDC049125]|uniref:cobalamin B12-binding domain-containing protein n=1 Tax=Microbispora sp. NPDC049125 TaxID=3154929 RepID=UPI003465EA14
MSNLTIAHDLSASAEHYLERIGEADEYAAVDVVLGLIEDGVPAEDVLLRVVAPAQRLVGELWASGTWSVAREHGATAVSERAVAAISARVRPRPTLGRATVACADGEYHALPARMTAEVLRLRGWRVDFLGASVPGRHLVTHLQQTGPDVVALGCALTTRLPRVHATITACQAVGVPVLAGGPGFGADGRFAALLGADGWAPAADAAADRLASGDLPSFPAPQTTGHLAGEEYAGLTRRRADLLTRVMAGLTRSYAPMASYSPQQLEYTAEDLGHIADFLGAALYVGEPAVFTDFVTWTCDILAARGVPADSVSHGLRIFHDELEDLPQARTLLAKGVEAASGAGGPGEGTR